MTDRREHVLVLAEISAAQHGFRDDLDTGVAAVLGVPVEAYRAYRQVCDAIDHYHGRPLQLPSDSSAVQLTLDGQRTVDAIGLARTIVAAGVDLYRRSATQIRRRPDEVTSQARRILVSALTLKTQLEHVRLEGIAERASAGEDGDGR